MVRVIADTNILINLYGAFLHKDENVKSLKSYFKLLNLISNKKIKIYSTPQIMREFNFCKGTNEKSLLNYANFIKKYISQINFSDENSSLIKDLTFSLGHEKINYTNEFGVLFKNKIVCEHAEEKNDKNYADTYILAESIVAGLPLVTINKIDFEGHKYCKPILQRNGIEFEPKVVSVQELIAMQKNQEQIF